MRNQTLTFTNDIRLNNIRQGADAGAAQTMGLLQFASTLQATANATTTSANAAPSAAPQPTFNAMDMVRAMQGGPSTVPPGGGPRQLGYGGEEGARQWEEEQRKKAKEKKRKRKAKKEKRKAKKAAKMAELINDRGLPYEQASTMVEDVYGESSDSDSSSSKSGHGLL